MSSRLGNVISLKLIIIMIGVLLTTRVAGDLGVRPPPPPTPPSFLSGEISQYSASVTAQPSDANHPLKKQTEEVQEKVKETLELVLGRTPSEEEMRVAREFQKAIAKESSEMQEQIRIMAEQGRYAEEYEKKIKMEIMVLKTQILNNEEENYIKEVEIKRFREQLLELKGNVTKSEEKNEMLKKKLNVTIENQEKCELNRKELERSLNVAVMTLSEKQAKCEVQLWKCENGIKAMVKPPGNCSSPFALRLGLDLIKAIDQRSTDRAKNLLERGACLNARDASNNTALHHSVGYYCSPVITAALLDAGMDPNVRGYFGTTPLHHASLNGRTSCMEVLMSRGADVNLGNDNNTTPLSYAAYGGHFEATKLLVEEGEAWVNAVDNNGQNALYWTAKGGNSRDMDFAARLIANSLPTFH